MIWDFNMKYIKLFENFNNEDIVNNIKQMLLINTDYSTWEEFIDNQTMGDCQGIVYSIIQYSQKNKLPVEKHFGNIKVDEPIYIGEKDEMNDLFTHHWVTINGEIYEFSKGTLKDHINFHDLYSVEAEDETIYDG